MMSLLVVDDEVIIAEGLYQMLQDTFQDELLVMRCNSFLEAQRILEANRIDILMTDIEMPDMTGLELHKWVNERFPLVRVIYLTGYSDFGYARQALQQKAVAYVLKSEGDGVIVEAVRRAIQSLAEESTTLLTRARDDNRHNRRVHQLIYHAMHGGSVAEEQMQQALQEGCLPFTVDEPFVLGYCYFDEQSHALHQSMNLIERLTGDRVNLLLTEMTSRAMLLLYQPKTRDERRSLRAVLETSQSILEKQNNLMTVCLMEDAVPWTHIPLTGDWLLEQVNRTSPSSGELLVIEKKDTSGQGQPLPFGEEWSDALDSLKRLNEYLLTGQKDLYFDEEARLWTLVDFRQNLRQAKTVGSALMMSILHSVSNLPESSSLRMQLEQYSVNAVHVPQTIPAELHRYAESFFDLRGQNKNNRQRSLVIKVNEYIAAHLEGDLSLTAIADAVHFHPVYLSRIYKENAGVSISDYIASQRLDCACALLRTTSTAVSTIARKTGFTSSNYFSRWFRKKTGMTPQEYREGGLRMTE